MNIGTRLANAVAVNVVRPWAVRDLPGWGAMVKLFVKDRGDEPWQGTEPVWGRGVLHGYEQLLDLKSWPSRMTYFTGRYYDWPTQQILQQLLKPGDIFVDIGANEGMISLVASKLVGSTGAVIAFEPNPKPRSFFEKAIRRNGIRNIRLEPWGVAAKPATLPLTVPLINNGEGSFGKPDPASGDAYVVECEVKPADTLLAKYHPALIKIDVEGFELEALNGIRETIDRCHPPVIMEMIAEHLHRAGTSIAEVRDFMETRGYRARRLDWGLGLELVELEEDMQGDVIWVQS